MSDPVIQQSRSMLIPFLSSIRDTISFSSRVKNPPVLSVSSSGWSPTMSIRRLPLPWTFCFGFLHPLWYPQGPHFGTSDRGIFNDCFGFSKKLSITHPLFVSRIYHKQVLRLIVCNTECLCKRNKECHTNLSIYRRFVYRSVSLAFLCAPGNIFVFSISNYFWNWSVA